MKAFTNGWLTAPEERKWKSVTVLKALSLTLQHEEFIRVYVHLRTHAALADEEVELCKTTKLLVNIT